MTMTNAALADLVPACSRAARQRMGTSKSPTTATANPAPNAAAVPAATEQADEVGEKAHYARAQRGAIAKFADSAAESPTSSASRKSIMRRPAWVARDRKSVV